MTPAPCGCIESNLPRFNPAWLEQSNGLGTHADFLTWFARDIANPSRDDNSFPVVRHRDFYAGHSWGRASTSFHFRRVDILQRRALLTAQAIATRSR